MSAVKTQLRDSLRLAPSLGVTFFVRSRFHRRNVGTAVNKRDLSSTDIKLVEGFEFITVITVAVCQMNFTRPSSFTWNVNVSRHASFKSASNNLGHVRNLTVTLPIFLGDPTSFVDGEFDNRQNSTLKAFLTTCSNTDTIHQ
jgi:hypothetical protein